MTLPITPGETATTSIDVARADAAVIHLDVPDPKDGRQTPDSDVRIMCELGCKPATPNDARALPRLRVADIVACSFPRLLGVS
jgi:hypothetical protein